MEARFVLAQQAERLTLGAEARETRRVQQLELRGLRRCAERLPELGPHRMPSTDHG